MKIIKESHFKKKLYKTKLKQNFIKQILPTGKLSTTFYTNITPACKKKIREKNKLKREK